MKKILIFLISVLALTLVLFSCGESKDDKGNGDGTTSSTSHSHAYGEWTVAKAPTCEAEGQEKRTCSCGEAETRAIAIIAHTEIVLEAKEESCTEDGLTEGKGCSACGAIIVAQVVIPAKPHTEETIPAKGNSCTEDGLTEGVKCSDCGVIIVPQQTIPASHTEKTVEGKDATCYETGLTSGKICTVCGVTTVEQEIIPITHVSEIVPSVEPDCYNKGLTEGRKCALCGTVLLPQDEIPEKHEPIVTPGYKEGCETDGLKDGLACSICGKVIQEQEVIPAHHELVLVPGFNATCTETGLTNGYTCSVCNKMIIPQEEIPYSLHNFVNGNCTHCQITEFSQGLAYELSADGEYYILVGKGTCKDIKIIIPETHLGKPVKEIGSQAFSYNNTFISIVIPRSIEKISSGSFTDTKRLVEIYNLSPVIITYNDGTGLYDPAKKVHTSLDSESILKQYGDFIFAELPMGEPSLVAYTGKQPKVVLPDDYNGEKYAIQSYAFYECRNMVSVVVPRGVVKVGLQAFGYCISLVEVYYLAGMQLEFNGSWMQGELGKHAVVINNTMDKESIVDIVDDYAFIVIEGEAYLVTYVGEDKNLVLPKDYNGEKYSIYQYAFELTDIESVVISSGVKSIGKCAFAQCKSLKSVTFEEGVTHIGEQAFGESAIRSVVLPNSLTSMETYAFYKCENLGYVVIGNGLESLPYAAFGMCSELVSVTLPSSLKTIDAGAFGEFYKLQEIVNHSSVVLTMGSDEYGKFAKYAKIIYTGVDDKATVFIEDDFVFIVIDGQYYLTSYVGDERDITLPKGINGNTYAIADHAFRYRRFVYSIVIPEGVTAIGNYSFRDMVHLKSIFISGSVKTIGDYAFRSCGSLSSVTLSEGVEAIGEWAFTYCSSLESLVIPKSMKAIGKRLFRYAENIKSVEFLDPENWYTTSTKGASSGYDQKPRTDAAANASAMSNDMYWYKKSN